MKREFPKLLKELHQIEIDYNDGDGIDFEPYDSFYSEGDTSEWIKAWTGNSELKGEEYLIFGQDGTGGYAAFWNIRNSEDLLKQPIVFFGSEGEIGVIARNFYEYLWLFANGIGPYEAISYPDIELPKPLLFIEFAEKNAKDYKSSAKDIIDRATDEFPNFEENIEDLCR